MMMMRRRAGQGLAAGTALSIAATAWGGSHLWDFSEVFSNADGTVQFIELHETNGANGEIYLAGKSIYSESTGQVFTFPSNLQGPTGNKYLLLATEAFAALPGAPTPDFIIPDGFFDADGDSLTYHVYDTYTFGAVPTDCVMSMNRGVGVEMNSPTNYGDEIGFVDCADVACPADLTGDDFVDAADLAGLLAAWGECARCPADLDGSGGVDAADLAALLAAWGEC